MSLADEIFPSKGHLGLVQTKWDDGWGCSSRGFQEAARFLTEHRCGFGAAIDQVGLVIFFLQRHRVELALKELLVFRKVDLSEIKAQHSLIALWGACSRTVGTSSKEWQSLDAAGSQLVGLLHERDPASYTFRYPVDRKGNPRDLPAFIDLHALEKYVDDLVYEIRGYMDYVAESERAAQEYEADMEHYAE